MIYNYPSGKYCEKCGKNISKEINEFLDNLEVVYNNWQYHIWDDGGIECDCCGTKYSIETGKMQVDVYINREDEEDDNMSRGFSESESVSRNYS